MLGKRDVHDKSQLFVSFVREEFDEIKVSNIIELKFQRIPFWSGRKMIYITFQSESISFLVCDFTPWGVMVMSDQTRKVFESIQIGMNTYQRS